MKQPKRKCDWVGRYVRLLQPLETRGGVMWPAGKVARVILNRSGLTLSNPTRCPLCGIGNSNSIVGVAEYKVRLLPEDYRPIVGEFGPLKPGQRMTIKHLKPGDMLAAAVDNDAPDNIGLYQVLVPSGPDGLTVCERLDIDPRQPSHVTFDDPEELVLYVGRKGVSA